MSRLHTDEKTYSESHTDFNCSSNTYSRETIARNNFDVGLGVGFFYTWSCLLNLGINNSEALISWGFEPANR